MKKTYFINETKSIFLESFKLIRDNPLIYAFGLLIGFSGKAILLVNLLFINNESLSLIISRLSVVVSLLFITWLAISLDFINQAYTKKKVKYKSFFKLLAKYFFRVIFVLFVFIFFSSLIVLVVRGAFSLFSNNPSFIEMKNTKKASILYRSINNIVFYLLITWTFYLSQIFIEVVAGKQKVIKSFGVALSYFFKNIGFFLVIAALAFGFYFVSYKMFNLIGDEVINEIVATAINILSGLFIGAAMIVKYHKVKN
ncbi:MAG: hypothetical protein GW941_00720 [Candidatus Pacebacteria bacterium]|nr:hypothetical protein [Candidatus Paceibacterota bacterium]